MKGIRTILTFTFVTVGALCFLGACAGSDAGNDGPDTEFKPDTGTNPKDTLDPPMPDFIARIQANPISGNSPLKVSFSVDVQGEVQPYELTYSWLIADTVGYAEAQFSHTFFQKGNHSVNLRTTYKTADGSSKIAEDHLTISVSGCADVKWNQVSLAPPVEVAVGDLVSLKQGTLFNDGDRIDGTFTVGVYLSSNEVFDPDSDQRIAQWAVEGMDSGIFGESAIDFTGKSFQISEGVEDGLYFVFLYADDGDMINECQEDNNIATSTNNLAVDSAVALKSDLTISEVKFAENLKLDLGENLNYQFQVANVGEGDATKFGLGFWLSTDKKLDPDEDTLMFGPEDLGATMQQLAGGVSQNFYKSYKIPETLADGQYWMIGMVDVDNLVLEAEEGNNVGMSAYRLTVEYKEEQCYDLSLDSLELSPLATYWNGTVQAAMEIANPGTVATPDNWKIRAYISLQASLNPATATQVGSWNMSSIGPGEVLNVDKIITIPNNIPVQPHYIGIIIDPDGDMTECSEGNNAAMFPEPIQVTSQATMDVAVNNVQYHPEAVEAGASIKVSYVLVNTGTSNATAFEVVVVLSTDPTLTYSDISSGKDLVVYKTVVANVPAIGSVARVEDVVIPIELPHDITTYYVGVVADPEKDLQLDKKKNNNIAVAANALTVTGALGGCFEDDHESNNTFGTAAQLEAGEHTGFGSCGDEDWFKVAVPADHSLIVIATVTPILGINPVASDLDIELIASDLSVIDSSTNAGDTEEVHLFNIALEDFYTLRVFPKVGNGPSTMASYDLDIQIVAPVDGVDLLSVDVKALPKSIYPGGLMNVSWNTANIGLEEAGSHTATIWASKDAELSAAEDLQLQEVEVDGVGAKTTEQRSHTFLLPADIPGGNWRFLVHVDSADVVVEASDENNVGASDVVFLDPLLTCDDDDLEPNNEIALATPLYLNDGLLIVNDAVACPSLDDWYSVDAEVGNAFNVIAKYDYDNNKGLLGLEIWDLTQTALLFKDNGIDSASVHIPWVWSSGTYYIRVHSVPHQGKVGPYEYDLTVTSGPGDSSDECEGDVFEDNNSIAVSQYIGCGLQGATLCKGDVDAYRIELDQWDSLAVTLDHKESALKMSLFESGANQASASKSGNGSLSYQAQVAQTVYLVVESKSDPLSLKSFDYTLFLDGVKGVDLTVSEPSLFMTEVYQGDDALIDFDIINSCVDVAGEFEATIWLSADDKLDAADIPLKTVTVAGIESKGSVAISEKVVIPFSTQPGSYYLLAEADAGGAVLESNEGNNMSGTGLSVAKLCLPDLYEPNDVLSQEEPFAPALEDGGAPDLALCPYELDWFSIQAIGGTTLTVDALFTQDEGDLDMRLYDPNYSTTIPVAVSATNDDNESITFPVAVTGTYLIRLHGFNGASASYDLEITAD